MPEAPAAPRNRLLASLSPMVSGALQPQLELVSLPHGQVLWEPNALITHVYFPLTAVLSQLTMLADGEALETGIIGNEGFAGLPVFLGLESDNNQVICQVAGTSLRMPSAGLRAALAGDDGSLQMTLQRSLQAFLVQITQTSACSRIHPLTERCARWLLHCHDRVGTQSFVLTQEFLGNMLGVRRPSVTIVAGSLQQAGLIRYHRGTITILDRVGLEAGACECYALITRTVDELVGAASQPFTG